MKTPPKPPPAHASERATKPALAKGWAKTCPRCGRGAMYHRYLKVTPTCPECGLDLHHHRADDGPAYITILISGHILGPIMVYIFDRYSPNPFALSVVFSIGFVAIALWLLPRVKGAFIAYQWAKRMHGFDDDGQP